MLEFSKTLISWYLKNKRDLPWRNTIDPYKIWLSEIMLQQTRVAQGLPYYLRFVDAYPEVFDLANADEEDVLKLWQGLGYYSRARNLHATARYVANDLNGIFPKNYKELKKLKGIGDYTASAIASICYKEPKAVLDGNVFRVLSRIYGIDLPINSSGGIKTFAKLSQDLIDVKKPDIFNQAIMDFGATQCSPKKPLCNTCVFNLNCVAFNKGLVSELPVKLKKIKIKKRYFNYIVPVVNASKTILNKRTKKGIWANLYEFPLIETENSASFEIISDNLSKINIENNLFELSLYNEHEIIHKLSHQHIHTKFWIATSETYIGKTISISDVDKYPVPVLISNFINKFML